MTKWDAFLNEVRLGAKTAGHMYYRLLVVGGGGDAQGQYIAEELGVPRLNVGEALGEELLEVPTRRRPLKVSSLLEDLIREAGDDGVLLDHIEILFEESLETDPLALLRNVSRRRLVVVMWSGKVDADNLVYGFPGHPEYWSHPAQDLTLVRWP